MISLLDMMNKEHAPRATINSFVSLVPNYSEINHKDANSMVLCSCEK